MANFFQSSVFESSDGNRGINPNGMYTGGGILGNLKDYVVKPPSPDGNVSSNNSTENNGEVKGKYMFIKDYIASTCSEYAGSMGIINPCVEYKYYNYKKGDVIDAQTFYVNAVKLPIKEQNLSVPMSYLKKVSDDTPLTKENISFGKTYIDNSKTEKNDEVLQSAEIKTAPSQTTSSQDKQNTKTSEDEFYEKLGIKYNPTWNSSRNKGRALILLIAIGSYFVYKKFKK
jgi:hypothetical protein